MLMDSIFSVYESSRYRRNFFSEKIAKLKEYDR